MPTDSIGSQQFVQLRNTASESGAPELPAEASMPFQRSGIDGVSIRKEGIKARPFRMLGRVDVDDEPDALAKVLAYKLLAGTSPTLTWRSVDYAAVFEAKYHVLEVQTTYRQLGAAIGGLSNNLVNPFWVESRWLLFPVHTPAVND